MLAYSFTCNSPLLFSALFFIHTEVSYPTSSSSVTAIQQVLGNLVSAAFFPAILLLRDSHSPINEMRRPLYFIAISMFVMSLLYVTFNGKYKRLIHEQEWDAQHEHSKLVDNSAKHCNCDIDVKHCHLHENGPIIDKNGTPHRPMYGTIRV